MIGFVRREADSLRIQVRRSDAEGSGNRARKLRAGILRTGRRSLAGPGPGK